MNSTITVIKSMQKCS